LYNVEIQTSKVPRFQVFGGRMKMAYPWLSPLEEELKWPTHGCPHWRKNENGLSMVAPIEDE
jgi:hypothetical protein